MAGLENEILKVIGAKEGYDAYRDYLPEEILSPVGRRLLKYVDKFHDDYTYPDITDWQDFARWLGHSAATKDSHLEAMQQICEVTDGVEYIGTARDVLNKAVERDVSEQILGHLEKDDDLDIATLRSLINELEEFRSSDLETDKLEVGTDIEDVLRNSHISDEGLPFSLPVLRSAIGPLRPGDTMYVVKRPEVGGTTFTIQQAGYMMENTKDTNAIIFSNEEDGNRLMIRLYQSVLNWTTKDILADPAKARAEYQRRMGSLDRVRIIHAASLHRRDCERVIEKYDPDLIVFNMLSKIGGFGNRNQSDVDAYTAQGVWMREIANGYGCAAMTSWQAGGSAHGKAWIESDDMYGSKTGIVAEADVILGIGKIIDPSEPEDHRYLHLAKNKLAGDSKTDEKLRHGYFNNIYINTEKARFYE